MWSLLGKAFYWESSQVLFQMQVAERGWDRNNPNAQNQYCLDLKKQSPPQMTIPSIVLDYHRKQYLPHQSVQQGVIDNVRIEIHRRNLAQHKLKLLYFQYLPRLTIAVEEA